MPTAKKAVEKKEIKRPNLFEMIKAKMPKSKNGKNGNDNSALWGKIGFTLGLVSVGAWLIPLLGIVIAIAGLVLNILGLRAEKGRWFAVTGLTLSIVFLNLSFIYGFYAVLISMLGAVGF